VRLLRADPQGFVFRVTEREKDALRDVLKLYPCVPPAHHRLRRTSKPGSADECQRLLDQALAEQRARNQRRVRALLDAPGTFRPLLPGWQFALRRSACEWLMQVLNDVRVGSWIALGSPEELPRSLSGDAAVARRVYAMELAGLFQMELLHALEAPSVGDA
jgi:hypothetical protein